MDTVNTVDGAIKEHCLRLLTFREHSQKELRTKLIQKGYLLNDIQPIIDQLAHDNWQSDTRFAESYARHRLRKGYGEIAIRYELKQKGIDFALDLHGILLTVAEDWMDLLTQVYCKKYGELSPVPRLEWAKRSRFLMQRGFSSSHISQFASESRIIHF
ncbi:MAG: hypothetical protein RL755_956 [Pseudomonadota bacterium]